MTTSPPLLYLVHRIPYPPNKGDKVRSYHLLRHLAGRYRVYLATFIDDPDDWQHLDTLKGMCADIHAEGLDPRAQRLKSLTGLLRGEALTLPYYRNPRLAAWAERVTREQGIQRAVAFSSAMAQYLPEGEGVRRIVDFVDVDSDKWRQYAATKRWPLSWVYRREARTLLKFEAVTAANSDGSVFVSPQEAALFRTLTGIPETKVHAIHNGVDFGFFDPARDYPDPYPEGSRTLAFTGAMDYWPNVDAVRWFATEVFPRVRAEVPEVAFYIVGARPTEEVRRLEENPGVEVTGAVEDMRPYLAHAALAVAPLRIARGIQNKVLEALAMERRVVASEEAAEGIGECPAMVVVSSDSPETYARAVVERLPAPAEEARDPAGRAFVRREFDWESNLSGFSRLLEATESGG